MFLKDHNFQANHSFIANTYSKIPAFQFDTKINRMQDAL